MRKFMSVMLTLILLVTMAVPAFADGIIGEMEMETEIQGLTEPNVRMLVSRYFAQRKAYLQGTADTISVAVEPMVTDEASHRNRLADAGVTLVDSFAVIDTVAFWSDRVPVMATETITYMINGETIQKTVSHDITVIADENGYLLLSRDGYAYELFSSTSYVPPELRAAAGTNAGGSSLCIVNVAASQIGTTIDANGNSKYGIWYGDLVNNDWFYSASWCAIFVAWCATYANVSRSIIPLRDAVPYYRDWYVGCDDFYTTGDVWDTYIPRAGDLVFTRTLYGEYGHIAIIQSMSGNYIYYIEGNAGEPDQVRSDYMSYDDTSITGYARVYYGSAGHSYSGSWYTDTTHHWRFCYNCGAKGKAAHTYGETWSYNAAKHWKTCTVCGATGNMATHIMIEDSMTGNQYCKNCLYGHGVIAPKKAANVPVFAE